MLCMCVDVCVCCVCGSGLRDKRSGLCVNDGGILRFCGVTGTVW